MAKKDLVQVQKRDGGVVLFNKQKITIAICKAMAAVDELDLNLAETMTEDVVNELCRKYAKKIPSVEAIQDVVEEKLIESGQVKAAKSYIIYRQKRAEIREARKAVLHGHYDDSELSLNALKLLENRYLLRDETGALRETPKALFKRVAQAVAQADKQYGGDIARITDRFEKLLTSMRFLPNSPCLMHAGTQNGALLAQHVLPIPDSVDGVFSTLRDAAIVQQAGGGTGFNFSGLRAKGSYVQGKGAIAMGPVSAMQMYNHCLQNIVQGGRRAGANMALLQVDHPDIMEFINLKNISGVMPNFNISVAVTRAFMEALSSNAHYDLIDPATHKCVDKQSARLVFDNIVNMAWRRGDPGLVFLDALNKNNPVAHLGKIKTTDPCANATLLACEGSAQGAINLLPMVDDDGIFNWERLKNTVHEAVHFLDNVLDVTFFPLQRIKEATLRTRKIGVGIMGFADLLYRLGIAYDSKKGLIWADKIMAFIHKEARNKSRLLAESRGVFPAWKKSTYESEDLPMRNAAVTAISPTGSISILADVSSGIEPNFAICYQRSALQGKEFVHVNPQFAEIAKRQNFYSESLIRQIALSGSLEDIHQVPAAVKKVFVTTQQISAEWHIRMQAAFQQHVDGAISKTINFPSSATAADVEQGFLLAHQLGCKGVTIYRDGSLADQVIRTQF